LGRCAMLMKEQASGRYAPLLSGVSVTLIMTHANQLPSATTFLGALRDELIWPPLVW